MCHEALTNEMDVLVNECALSYILFKETVQKENDCHCLFTILLTILNIMTSKMTNSSYDLYIIIFKVFWSHIIVLREKQTKLYVNNLQPMIIIHSSELLTIATGLLNQWVELTWTNYLNICC